MPKHIYNYYIFFLIKGFFNLKNEDVKEGGLDDRAARLKEKSAALRTEVDETRSDLSCM